MSELPKTVWVTKYALTEGLHQCPVRSADAALNYLQVMLPRAAFPVTFGRKEWAYTREAALARAEEMRAAKITSLKRQIERLKALEF